MVSCPVCGVSIALEHINAHLDSNCQEHASSNAPAESGESVPVSSATPSFFTPTQPRKNGPTVKREVLETPPQDGSPRKRKLDHDDESKDEQSSSNSQKARHTPRGKEAFNKAAPLADRVRPRVLNDFIGQEDLVGPAGLLRGLIEAGRIPSLIFWGSSGTGKTTLARIIARTAGQEYLFRELSATSNNVADCKKVFEEASNVLSVTGKRTLVFLDEIHRFTKSQQDVFLPYVESGRITLVGATTENPSFRINNALISRCRVFTLAKLSTENVEEILRRALQRIEDAVLDEVIAFLAGLCDGDARVALNLLDMVLSLPRETLSIDSIRTSLKRTTIAYDRAGDEHYDTISALHKSVRGSDVDASLYYLGRMLESGEDPLYIARRMVRIASEDVGMADCNALPLLSAIYTSVQQVGMPEADCILAQGVVYLAQAPKSIAVYKAYKRVKTLLRKEDGAATASIPMHIRNAPTGLMKELGYGKGYQYNPEVEGEVDQTYLPETLAGRTFYEADTDSAQPLWSEMDEGERLL